MGYELFGKENPLLTEVHFSVTRGAIFLVATLCKRRSQQLDLFHRFFG